MKSYEKYSEPIADTFVHQVNFRPNFNLNHKAKNYLEYASISNSNLKKNSDLRGDESLYRFDSSKVNNDYVIPEKTKRYQSLLGKFKLLKFKKKITILFSNIELYDSVEIYIKDVFLPKIRSCLFKEISARFQELQNIFEILLEQTKSHEILFSLNDHSFDIRFFSKLSLPCGMFPRLVNCLYNSISMICFNTQRHFRIIKALSMYVMIKNREKFEHYMKAAKYDFNFETFLERTSLEGEYGTELNIISIALMLNKNIACYNECVKKDLPNRIMFKINDSESTDVILGLAEVHYFPIYCIGNTFNEHRNVKETVLNLEEYFSKLDQKVNFNESNVSVCLDHNNIHSHAFLLTFLHLALFCSLNTCLSVCLKAI